MLKTPSEPRLSGRGSLGSVSYHATLRFGSQCAC